MSSGKIYTDKANRLSRPFDFSVSYPDNKEWFYVLNTSPLWLSSDHIDVGMYYLRQKQFYAPEWFTRRWTTTDCLFEGNITGHYVEFVASPESFVWDLDGVIASFATGHMPRMGRPWTDVDEVYIPINVDNGHWVLGVFDIDNLVFRVYDSLKTGAEHDAKVLKWVERFARMIPSLCKALKLAEVRPGLDRMGDQLEIELVSNIPRQTNSGDCGMFLIKFAEFLASGVSITECTQERMPFFRNKMAVELYSHALFKSYDVYHSDSEGGEEPN